MSLGYDTQAKIENAVSKEKKQLSVSFNALVNANALDISEKLVREGDTCSEEQAHKWLIEDIQSHMNQLSHYINVPVTENEFIALTSWAFNVGVTAVSRSALLHKLNAGDTEAAATEFLDFCYAGGKRVKGLVNRRKAEYELFTTD